MTQQEEVVMNSRPVDQEGHCFLVVEVMSPKFIFGFKPCFSPASWCSGNNISIGARGLGLIFGSVKWNTVALEARHSCDGSSDFEAVLPLYICAGP